MTSPSEWNKYQGYAESMVAELNDSIPKLEGKRMYKAKALKRFLEWQIEAMQNMEKENNRLKREIQELNKLL